jgi:hypothetical protein
MGNDKTIYNDIFDGDYEEAKKQFPFLDEGLNLRIIGSPNGGIAIFPKEKTFLVATVLSYTSNKRTFIEETNSINILNIIVKRTTGDADYLDESRIAKIKEFLEANNCQEILYEVDKEKV